MAQEPEEGGPLRLRFREIAAPRHGLVVWAITTVLAAAIGLGLWALGEWDRSRQRDRVAALLERSLEHRRQPIDPNSELGAELVELVANSDPDQYWRWGRIEERQIQRPRQLEVGILRRLSTLGGRVTVHGWRPYRDAFGRYVVCFECDYAETEYEPLWEFEADLERWVVRYRYATQSDRMESNVVGGYFALMLLIFEAVVVLGWQWFVLQSWDGTRDFVRARPLILTRPGRRGVVLPFPYRCRPT